MVGHRGDLLTEPVAKGQSGKMSSDMGRIAGSFSEWRRLRPLTRSLLLLYSQPSPTSEMSYSSELCVGHGWSVDSTVSQAEKQLMGNGR